MQVSDGVENESNQPNMAQFTKNSNHPPSYGSIIADSSMESPENLFKKSTGNFPENSPEKSPENGTENSAENLSENLNENSPENSRVNSFEYPTNHSTANAKENSSIMINVISGYTLESFKEWKNKNLSGRYQMVDTLYNWPAYKVSFIVDKVKLT